MARQIADRLQGVLQHGDAGHVLVDGHADGRHGFQLEELPVDGGRDPRRRGVIEQAVVDGGREGGGVLGRQAGRDPLDLGLRPRRLSRVGLLRGNIRLIGRDRGLVCRRFGGRLRPRQVFGHGHGAVRDRQRQGVVRVLEPQHSAAPRGGARKLQAGFAHRRLRRAIQHRLGLGRLARRLVDGAFIGDGPERLLIAERLVLVGRGDPPPFDVGVLGRQVAGQEDDVAAGLQPVAVGDFIVGVQHLHGAGSQGRLDDDLDLAPRLERERDVEGRGFPVCNGRRFRCFESLSHDAGSPASGPGG